MSISSTLRAVSILALLLLAGGTLLRAQEVPGTDRTMPDGTFSLQAAGPELRVANLYVFGSLICATENIDTIKVYNDGNANLTVTASRFGTNQADFTIISPTGQFTIRPRDSANLIVRFAPGSYGSKTATIRLVTNDTRPGMSSFEVKLTAEWLRSEATISATVLDFGEICANSTRSLSLTVNYTGDIDDKLNGVPKFLGANGAQFTVLQPTSEELGLRRPSDRKVIVVQFNPKTAGTFIDSARISVGQCLIPFTFVVRGSAVDMRPQLYQTPDSINFGQRAVGAPGGNSIIKVQNFGTSTISVQSIFIEPPSAAAQFVTPNSMIGRPISPAGIETGTITFKPTSIGVIDARLGIVLAKGGCIDTLFVKLHGEGVAPVLSLTRTQLDFTADSCSEIATVIYDTVYLHNRGTLPANVHAVFSDNSPRVNARLYPALMTRLVQGDSVGIIVEIRPGQPGAPTARVLVATDDPDPDRDTLVIDVTMKLESTVIKLLLGDGSAVPAAIDFGTTFGCLPKRDTFMLRNAGTLNAVVRGGFVQGTAFSLSPAPPYALMGNLDTALLVVFDPPAAGEYRDTLTLQNGTCSDQVIRVAVAGRRYDLTFDVAGIDFGQSNIGVARTGSAAFTNTSATPADVKVRVIDAFITPSDPSYTLVREEFPIDLAPGETINSTLFFQPSLEIDYDAEICYVTEVPCIDTICVPIGGRGIRSDIFVTRSSMNFGSRYTCDGDTTLTLTVRNIGTKPLEISGMTILPGPDAGAFTRVTTLTLPATVAPVDSIQIVYSFDPRLATANGPLSATLEIVSDDLNQDTILLPISARRRSYSVQTPAQVAFGRVLISQSGTQTFTLINRSADTIRLGEIDITAPYSIDGDMKKEIAPLDSVVFTVTFSPTDTLLHDAMLRLTYGNGCFDTAAIALSGEGRPPLRGFAEILVPGTLKGGPGDHVAIPLILQRSNLIESVGATTFRAVVRFNGTLLEPTGARGKNDPFGKGTSGTNITTGRIVQTVPEGKDLLVTVEIANSPMPAAPDTIGYVDARVLLGNAISTPITVDSIAWLDGLMNSETVPGTFNLTGFCDIGGNRILRVSGDFGIKSVAPNPFNPATEIIIETAEAGPPSLYIHDATGRRVAVLIDGESLPVQAHSRVWDASAYPSGIYYLELVTPTQRSLQTLWLVK